MFNLGFSELILLAIIALIFIGPEQLPEVARTVARLLNEWKRATSDLKSNFLDDVHQQIIAPQPPPANPPPAEAAEPQPTIAPHSADQEKKESES